MIRGCQILLKVDIYTARGRSKSYAKDCTERVRVATFIAEFTYLRGLWCLTVRDYLDLAPTLNVSTVRLGNIDLGNRLHAVRFLQPVYPENSPSLTFSI